MNRYFLEYICCLICLSNDYSVFLENVKGLYLGYKDKFNILKCAKYGCVFTKI